ncbi:MULTISPECIES: glycosyltransferase family 4 protein [unclassified Natrinema]|uniref:glycosyltransferase family 4 protein n=1 Tax=unclassified Natrinema TaxID=2622230 RepID=UPI00026D46B4|nr:MULTISPECIES: glycosyltransferase family 4 protein [unclassified Natrinema]AFO59068.1 glycosyl transferase group 1 [Natrinema sp. J7-2]
MDIGFVTNVVFPFVKGGAEKRIHEIGTRLAADGHDITIYGRRFWEGPQVMDYEGMTLYGVAPSTELYADKRRSITEAIDFSVRLLPHLRRTASEHDLIVASLFPYFPVLASKLTTLTTETPLITTWHEVWLDYWDDYLGYLAPFGKGIERLTATTPHYPIAVSSVTADRLTKIGPSRDQIEVIPNGIDVDQIESARPADNGFSVLYAGRLAEHKNVDLLLEAFDRVADSVPDATLGVIGDGPERDRLERQVETLEHADRVTMLGFLEEYEDVLSHMRAADVFASPSTREGFGITFAEAMAADCTVIAATHPESAASEVIGDAGFLVSPTVGGVATALKRALEGGCPSTDPTTQAQQFDWDAIANQAEQCYRRAINGE